MEVRRIWPPGPQKPDSENNEDATEEANKEDESDKDTPDDVSLVTKRLLNIIGEHVAGSSPRLPEKIEEAILGAKFADDAHKIHNLVVNRFGITILCTALVTVTNGERVGKKFVFANWDNNGDIGAEAIDMAHDLGYHLIQACEF